MKILILMFLVMAMPLLSNEYKEYVIKFKKYDINTIEKYKKDYDIKKYFSLSNEKLLELKLSGEKLTGNKLNDLRTYFFTNLTQLEYRNIKKDKNISIIYENIKNIPRPIAEDIAPVTGNWVNKQGYIDDFEHNGGLNAKYGWQFVGGKGKNVTIADIEGGWTTDHEDLGIEDENLYDENGKNLTGTPKDGENHDNNHGTSVLGEIASADNSYGTTGIANKANIKVINDYSAEYGYSTADAILRGISVLEVGSIILLESQKAGPNYHYDSNNPESQHGLVPDEWYQAEFDAIKTASSNGFIVIEAGANGEQNLDDPVYHSCNGDINTFFGDKTGTQACFDVDIRDSGAIIVGAGNPPRGNWGTHRAKMYYTSYGKRVDVQAWGMEIYTTGYGDVFYPNSDDKQAYTKQFGGTSGASPMITGITAVLQSRYKEKNNGQTLNAIQIREILKDPNNSRPQNGDEVTEHIGPQPDIELIFRNYLNDVYSCDPKCSDWEYCDQDNAICKPQDNRCNENEYCSSELDCKISTHTCVEPCTLLECKDWENCNAQARKCELKIGMCNNKSDCNEEEYCNPVTNQCIDYCKNLTCQENSTCTRTEDKSYAECVCDAHYLMNDANICEYVKPKPIKKPRNNDSCSFSDEGSYLNLIFIMFFLFLLSKKSYNFKNNS